MFQNKKGTSIVTSRQLSLILCKLIRRSRGLCFLFFVAHVSLGWALLCLRCICSLRNMFLFQIKCFVFSSTVVCVLHFVLCNSFFLFQTKCFLLSSIVVFVLHFVLCNRFLCCTLSSFVFQHCCVDFAFCSLQQVFYAN